MKKRIPIIERELYADECGNITKPDGSLKYCQKRKGGYLVVEILQYHGPVRFNAHRLVWMAFNGPIPDGMEIDHIDRNPSNNALDNLRVVSRSQNRANSKARVDSVASTYVGVINGGGSGRSNRNRWRGRVKKAGVIKVTRLCKCPTAAAILRDRLAVEAFGDHASLNFPELYGRAEQPSAALHR